jgi:glycosyltransferase involved in cell wall biosynthesis
MMLTTASLAARAPAVAAEWHPTRSGPARPPGTATVRVAFAIENHLGHRTLMSNMRAALADEPGLAAVWIPIDARGNGIFDRVPGIRDTHALMLALSALRGLWASATEGPIDIAFLHTQRMAHLLAPWMRWTPTFLSIDATPALLERYRAVQGRPHQGRSRYALVRDALHRLTYRLARGVVCMSELVREIVIRDYGVPRDKTLVLWPGVDLGAWHPPAERAAGSDVRLLFVGGDFDRKGGDLLHRWARETQARGWTLDVVTDHPIDPPAHVRHHPPMKPNDPRLRELARQADLFVLPTRADVSSWVIAEAKASGTAVLSTRVGSVPELVRDGMDGWLIPSEDAPALAACLEEALRDRSRLAEFGARAREDAELRFDARRNARTLMDFMRAHR